MGLLGGALVGPEVNDIVNDSAEKLIARAAHDICSHGTQALSSIESGMSHVSGILENFTPSVFQVPNLNMANHNSTTSDRIGSQAHQMIDRVFSTNLRHSYTPEAISLKSQYGATLGMLPGPGCIGGPSAVTQAARQYTRSNLRLGQQMHEAYKIDIANNQLLRKEFRLPSGRRIDFVDFENGILYELKPNNPRSIRLGNKQLQLYKQEIETVERYKHILWKTSLELY